MASAREKAASKLRRKPHRRLSKKERHKRLLKKDRTYNEREDRFDAGIAGRSMVVDELMGGKDPGSRELQARQWLKLMKEQEEALSMDKKSKEKFQRLPYRGPKFKEKSKRLPYYGPGPTELKRAGI